MPKKPILLPHHMRALTCVADAQGKLPPEPGPGDLVRAFTGERHPSAEACMHVATNLREAIDALAIALSAVAMIGGAQSATESITRIVGKK